MFENYSKKAKRIIFYSRREAGEYGAIAIDTEHLLLGLVREDETLIKRFILSTYSIKSLHERIEQNITKGSKILGSVDMPLSEGYKEVLAYAADEAKQLSSKYIDTKHLLLGILRANECLAAKILEDIGLKYSTVRKEIENESDGN
jgi:ATP-dependent Clp protease ATP-binding subunit ClpC